MLALKDWLPDFKGALNAFYDEKIKDTVENKSTEYKELFEKHLTNWNNTQKALIAIALAIFLLLAIAYFWKDSPGWGQPKYIAIGVLTGYLLLYIYDLNLLDNIKINQTKFNNYA